jgi:hypothetical protein
MAVFTDFDPSFTINFVSCAAVAGTTSTFTSTVTTSGIINGKFVTTLAAQTNAASPTTDAATGAAFNALSTNKTCVLVFGQTAAGALQLIQGPIIDTAAGVTTTVGAFIQDPQFPSAAEQLPAAGLHHRADSAVGRHLDARHQLMGCFGRVLQHLPKHRRHPEPSAVQLTA